MEVRIFLTSIAQTKMPENQILQGIGELVDEKEKKWVKKNLKSEAVFLLKNYIFALK